MMDGMKTWVSQWGLEAEIGGPTTNRLLGFYTPCLHLLSIRIQFRKYADPLINNYRRQWAKQQQDSCSMSCIDSILIPGFFRGPLFCSISHGARRRLEEWKGADYWQAPAAHSARSKRVPTLWNGGERVEETCARHARQLPQKPIRRRERR